LVEYKIQIWSFNAAIALNSFHRCICLFQINVLTLFLTFIYN